MASTTAPPPASRPSRRGQAEEQDVENVVVEPYRLTPKTARRIALLGGLVLIGFAALLLRLWALQVLAGPQYVARARANQLRTVGVQAPRGAIIDRNGDVLVANKLVTAVELWPSGLSKVYARRVAELHALAHVTRVPLHQITKLILGRKRANDLLDPVVVRPSAPPPMQTYLEERAADFPGVSLYRSYIRKYPHGYLAAQLLGYVSQSTTSSGDEIGQSGVEASYNRYLFGVPGSARVRVDSLGRPQGSRTVVTQPQSGDTVRLTIDTGLQLAAENALQYGIQLAQANHQWYADGGAIVAMNAQDGSILALASAPTYDPSVFSGRVSEKRLREEGLTPQTALAKNYPLLDRAVDGEYPPGSSFKPLTAIAAMQAHILNPYKYLSCTGTYRAPEDTSHHVFHNWDPYVNQAMDLPTALAYSCDTYFYRVGNTFYELPADRGQPLQYWARRFGFGQATGVGAGAEASGILPTIAWKKRQYTRQNDLNWRVDQLWKPGDSIQLAIGQGDLLVTPVQMARLFAAIANGGKLVTPHVLMDVENPNGTLVPTAAPPAPTPIRGLDSAYLRAVQLGLYEGTHESYGTSYGVFGNFPVSIAGKTGTAQKTVTLPGFTGEADQSWWCGYGPVSPTPELVVCAVIENGGEGGAAAAPAAERVFAKFFHVSPKPLGRIHSD